MKYVKKPIVVDAVRFTREMAEGSETRPSGVIMQQRTTNKDGKFPDYCDDGKYLTNFQTCHRHAIDTLEGRMNVQVGDWIITGVNGEHYPCKPDIFEKTYDPVLKQPDVRSRSDESS